MFRGVPFAPAPEEYSGQESHISVPGISSLYMQRWGQEPAGGRGDNRSVFGVVAAGAVGFARGTFNTCPQSRFGLGRRKEG